MKKCPFCAEEIQDEAKKCRFCGEWLKDETGKQQADLMRNNISNPEVMSSHLNSKERVKESAGITIYIKTNWLWFWTYIRIPLTIIGAIIVLMRTPYFQEKTQISPTIAIVFCIFLFYGYVAVKLSQRKLIGWKLNWVIIFFEPIIAILDRSLEENNYYGNLVYILGCLVWMLANSIYFRKRKGLFS